MWGYVLNIEVRCIRTRHRDQISIQIGPTAHRRSLRNEKDRDWLLWALSGRSLLGGMVCAVERLLRGQSRRS